MENMDNLRQERESFMRLEEMKGYRELASKTQFLFWLSIGSIVLSVGTALGLLTDMASAGSAEQAARSASSLAIAIAVMSLGVGLAFSFVTMGMGKQNTSFRTAGMYYLISSLISFAYDLSGNNIVRLFASALAALYILKFSLAMNESLHSVDNILAESWDKFRTAYFIMIGASILCTFIAFIPIIGLLALLGIFACAIAAIVLQIWEIILLYKSAAAFSSYMPGRDRF
ncbi:MAG: hypothetical protein J5685_00875 [Clostridiales bacterium]|nr:hypothetical protein [Clostridiales bacterium]